MLQLGHPILSKIDESMISEKATAILTCSTESRIPVYSKIFVAVRLLGFSGDLSLTSQSQWFSKCIFHTSTIISEPVTNLQFQAPSQTLLNQKLVGKPSNVCLRSPSDKSDTCLNLRTTNLTMFGIRYIEQRVFLAPRHDSQSLNISSFQL